MSTLVLGGELFDEGVEFWDFGAQAWEVDDDAFLGAAGEVSRGHGFILVVNLPSELARFSSDVLPILRERGLFRREYEASTLRGNLGLPIPENVHTVARTAAAREEQPVPP